MTALQPSAVSSVTPVGSFSFWLPTSSQRGRMWGQQHSSARGPGRDSKSCSGTLQQHLAYSGAWSSPAWGHFSLQCHLAIEVQVQKVLEMDTYWKRSKGYLHIRISAQNEEKCRLSVLTEAKRSRNSTCFETLKCVIWSETWWMTLTTGN